MHPFKHVPMLQELRDIHSDFSACLFDMDGTLTNTEIHHARALAQLLREDGNCEITDDEVHALCVGRTDQQVYEALLEQGIIGQIDRKLLEEKKSHYFSKFLNNALLKHSMDTNIPVLLSELKSNGIKMGLVTSSNEHEAREILKSHRLMDYFEVHFFKETTPMNKPHPMPYLEAMKKLNTAPSESIIFEDSTTGIAAAKAANVATIIVAQWYQN